MADADFGPAEVKRLAAALQAVRHGEADALAVHTSGTARAEAHSTALEFVRAFDLDVAFTDLPDGFRLELRSPPSRTITLDL